MAAVPRQSIGSIPTDTSFDTRDALLYGPRWCVVKTSMRCQEYAGCGGCAIYLEHTGNLSSSPETREKPRGTDGTPLYENRAD